MGQLIGALVLFLAIISPLINRGNTVVTRKEADQSEETQMIESNPVVDSVRIHQSTRAKIIERVPAQYPLFLKAAQAAMENEEECWTVKDTSPQVFAWGLIGHWRKENGMCLGAPHEKCNVSSTGARGPMQFMPRTWEKWGRDGDGDGVKNSETLADSAYAAAAYLCHLRKVEGSWSHAMCRYYGDDVDTCVYERRVRHQIEEIKTVLTEEAVKNQKPLMTLSKAKSAPKVR